MKNAVKIFGFTILVAAFYSYVGQMVPQSVTYPPEETELGENLTTEELVEVGAEIAAGEGTCLSCHTTSGETGGRFPDLAGIGAEAGQRREGYSDVEYLAESLYEPNTFVVEGFLPGMPQVNQPPVDLNDRQILALIAYLQSLGGEPTVTLDTELRWQTEENAGAAAAPAPSASQTQASTSAAQQDMTGEEIFQTYHCGTCHSISEPAQMVGPSLHDVGSRLSKTEIYESILEPDAQVTEGYAPGVMTAQLNATGFYNKVSSQQLKTLVEFLASKEGGS